MQLTKGKTREIPMEFFTSKHRPVYFSICDFQANVALVSYIPKKGKVFLVVPLLHVDDRIDS